MQPSAADIIRCLDLKPHPEGGHYRETFRDAAVLADGRATSTAIYYLLQHAEISRWHRVDAAEVWHWHSGAPLQLSVAASPEALRHVVLGGDVLAGQHPQAAVPAGDWQQAQSLGAWTLVGCTVAPGFTFAGFEIDSGAFAAAVRRARGA